MRPVPLYRLLLDVLLPPAELLLQAVIAGAGHIVVPPPVIAHPGGADHRLDVFVVYHADHLHPYASRALRQKKL